MEHDIIFDLLPLYYDEVCSEASRAAVEAHLQTCAVCRAALAELDDQMPWEEQMTVRGAVEELQSVAAEWRKGKWKSWLKGACAAMAVCLLAAAAWYALLVWYCVPMTGEDYTIRTYQLEDGAVGVHTELREGKETRYALTWRDEADGRHFYMERPIIRNNPYEIDFSGGQDSRYLPDGSTMYFGLGEDSVLLHSGDGAANHPAATEEEAQRWMNWGLQE